MNDYGIVTEPGTLELERVLPGPIERVWACLTEPEQRKRWLADGPMDLRSGGRFELRFRNSDLSPQFEPTPERYREQECASLRGRVTRCEAPHRLSLTWGDGAEASEVDFELQAEGAQVRLRLTHRKLRERAMLLSVSAGWHTHLAILGDVLAQRPPRPFWSTHAALEAAYAQRL